MTDVDTKNRPALTDEVLSKLDFAEYSADLVEFLIEEQERSGVARQNPHTLAAEAIDHFVTDYMEMPVKRGMTPPLPTAIKLFAGAVAEQLHTIEYEISYL